MIYWTSIPTFTLSSLIRGLKSILPVSIRNLKSFFIPLFLMPLSNWSASSLIFRTYPKHGHFSQHLHTTVQADSSCLDPCKRLPTELPASTLVPPPQPTFPGQSENSFKTWIGSRHFSSQNCSEMKVEVSSQWWGQNHCICPPIAALLSWLHFLLVIPPVVQPQLASLLFLEDTGHLNTWGPHPLFPSSPASSWPQG